MVDKEVLKQDKIDSILEHTKEKELEELKDKKSEAEFIDNIIREVSIRENPEVGSWTEAEKDLYRLDSPDTPVAAEVKLYKKGYRVKIFYDGKLITSITEKSGGKLSVRHFVDLDIAKEFAKDEYQKLNRLTDLTESLTGFNKRLPIDHKGLKAKLIEIDDNIKAWEDSGKEPSETITRSIEGQRRIVEFKIKELEEKKPEKEKVVDKNTESVVENKEDPAGIKGRKFIYEDHIFLIGDFDPEEKRYQLIDFEKGLPVSIYIELEYVDQFIENNKEVIKEKDESVVEGEKTKEPWEMTRDEFWRSAMETDKDGRLFYIDPDTGNKSELSIDQTKQSLLDVFHMPKVEQAIKEGKIDSHPEYYNHPKHLELAPITTWDDAMEYENLFGKNSKEAKKLWLQSAKEYKLKAFETKDKKTKEIFLKKALYASEKANDLGEKELKEIEQEIGKISKSEKSKTAEDYEKLIMEARNQGKNDNDKEIRELYIKAMEIYEKEGDFFSVAEFTERIYGKDDNRTKGAWLKVEQVNKLDDKHSWIQELSEDLEEQEKIKNGFDKILELTNRVDIYEGLLEGALIGIAVNQTKKFYLKHKK